MATDGQRPRVPALGRRPGCGFTPARPRVPVVEDGDFGCRRVNPEDQRHDPGSLLNWMERLIRRRKETPELSWGTFWVLPPGDPAVLRCAASGAARRC